MSIERSGPKKYLDTRVSWIVWSAGVFAYLVAVTQRTSFGVAGLDATERFHASAAILSVFTVLQYLVYAGMQIPVGILVDRFGPRFMVTAGATLMCAGQTVLAVADHVSLGYVGRALVGAGDAMTFISVLRLLPAWFSNKRIPVLNQVTGMVGQIGQLLSLVPFAAFLHVAGWTSSFLSLASLSLLAVILSFSLIRDMPPEVRAARGISGPRLKVRTMLSGAVREPATRLGFWTHWTTSFGLHVVLMAWGYPFLVAGQGLDPAAASGLLSIFVVMGFIAGPVIGSLTARYPIRRSTMALGSAWFSILSWTAVILWPGKAPLALLIILFVALAVGGPMSMIGFDFARSFNSPRIIGTATGVVNVGGFLGALLSIGAIGVVLDLVRAASGPDAPLYTLDGFRMAFAFLYIPYFMGLFFMWRLRKRVRARMVDEDGVTIKPLHRVIYAGYLQRRHRKRRHM